MPSISTQPNRAYPSIPEITEDSVSHTIALQAIKDALQTHERRDNNFLKSFVRFEELVDLSIINVEGDFVLRLFNPGTVSLPGISFIGDPDTGIFSPGANIVAITVGGTEAIRWTGSSAPLIRTGMNSGITASTTQTQAGATPLTASWNEVAVVVNNNDAVLLPDMVKGEMCVIINNGAKKLKVFPAPGKDCGAGINTSVTIKTNSSRYWFHYDNTVAFDIATDFKNLQNIEVGGAANNDLLFRSGGDWTHTNGALTWDGEELLATAIEGGYMRSASATTTNLEDITHAINTAAGKKLGSWVFNSTTKKPVWAVGNADGSVWVDATGVTAHTPA